MVISFLGNVERLKSESKSDQRSQSEIAFGGLEKLSDAVWSPHSFIVNNIHYPLV